MEKFCCVKEISWDNPESAEAGLMAYTLLQVSMSMSCHSGQSVWRTQPVPGRSSNRAGQPAGHLMPHAQALDHSVTDAPHLFQTATRMGSPSDLRARWPL